VIGAMISIQIADSNRQRAADNFKAEVRRWIATLPPAIIKARGLNRILNDDNWDCRQPRSDEGIIFHDNRGSFCFVAWEEFPELPIPNIQDLFRE